MQKSPHIDPFIKTGAEATDDGDTTARLRRLRHSCAHVLAQAVQERFAPLGEVALGGGPATEDGFYYDFALPRPATPDDLVWLEERMRAILAEGHAFAEDSLTEADARRLFASEPFKLELIDGLAARGAALTAYRHGSFIDLCRGPHVERTSDIPLDGFKLLSVAGAYWRGDEKRPMLQRIYGTAWLAKTDLDRYLWRRAEAERRDHRRIGREQELFFFHPTAPGMAYWLPRGLFVMNELLRFWREVHASEGYQEIASPLVNSKTLWEQSGHWRHYRDEMFLSEMGESEVYGLKPMNCPNAMIVFNHRQRSYRELPLRLSDCDVLHRKERRGALHGLMRAQKFQQDDAHIFLTEEQIEAEFARIIALVRRFYAIFGLEYRFRLSTRPADSMGDPAVWDRAEAALHRILASAVGEGGYALGHGDGAFYGPKIDIMIEDALGRAWQMGTIQLDMQLPGRFGCEYVDRDGRRKTPVVVHRVLYGSLERFIAILLEHTGGALPLWLAPEQVRLVTVADRHADAAVRLGQRLSAGGARVVCDDADASVGAKIRRARQELVPYVVVVGDREAADPERVDVRLRDGALVGMSLDELAQRISAQVAERAMTD
jgi:threonyl-tRNA synthetase